MEHIIKTMNTCVLIILYNPNIKRLLENIDACIKQFEKIILIDNSEIEIDYTILSQYKKYIHYKWLGENRGIAYALNHGCKEALKFDIHWILTLDQDSVIPENLKHEYIDTIKSCDDNLGAITCSINNCRTKNKSTEKKDCVDVLFCQTSGTMMNLDIFFKCGGFKNELFIDSVDFEYCLKLHEFGYKLVKNTRVILSHRLGDCKEYSLFGRHLFFITNHNYVRRYYMTRNSLWLSKKYSSKYPECKFSLLKQLNVWFKIIFFESEKLKKIKSIIQGHIDYRNGIWGKYKY